MYKREQLERVKYLAFYSDVFFIIGCCLYYVVAVVTGILYGKVALILL